MTASTWAAITGVPGTIVAMSVTNADDLLIVTSDGKLHKYTVADASWSELGAAESHGAIHDVSACVEGTIWVQIEIVGKKETTQGFAQFVNNETFVSFKGIGSKVGGLHLLLAATVDEVGLVSYFDIAAFGISVNRLVLSKAGDMIAGMLGGG